MNTIKTEISAVINPQMNTRLKKGTIELSVLAILTTSDSYGYTLGKALNEKIGVKEGTVYLILQRLERIGMIDSYIAKKGSNKQRKYYCLTKEGHEYYNQLLVEWLKLDVFIQSCIKGEFKYE